MGNRGTASNQFNAIKTKISSVTEDNKELVIKECEDFVNNVIVDGMNCGMLFYQEYCAYAAALGVRFVRESNEVMFVCLKEGKTSLNIQAFNLMSLVNSEYEILFILAHEVKHLLFSHLLKYGSMFYDDVVQVFLNLSTDVEVNESLKRELEGYLGISLQDVMSKYVPPHLYDLNSASETLGMSKSYLQEVYTSLRYGRSGKTIADILYSLYDKKCKETLGYSIMDILYRIILDKNTCFSEEIFKVVDGKASTIFNIKDSQEAVRFCKSIARYLERNITAFIIGTSSNSSFEGLGGASGTQGQNGEDNWGSGEGNPKSTLKNFKRARGECAVCGVSSRDVKELLKSTEELQQIYLHNTGKRNRSVFGSGKTSVDLGNFASVIPWQSILKQRVNTLSRDLESTKRRINRRQPHRLDLSGNRHKHAIKLVIALDESGSISSKEYSYFLSEVKEIAKLFNCEIHLYEFTSKVESYTFMKEGSSKKNFLSADAISKFKTRFSGGTRFQPVFDVVSANKKIIKSESLMIILTDGYGESTVDFKKIQNRMWVVVGKQDDSDRSISCEELGRNIFPIVNMKKY